jgi:hypothetical protein
VIRPAALEGEAVTELRNNILSPVRQAGIG